MKELKISTNSSDETMNVAKSLAKLLNKGDTVVLTGDLGAGKTKFTEGFIGYYGLQDEISSPTFTIINEYSAPISTIYHFDVYRLTDIDEFYAIGGEEYFDKGICLIEWGELIEDALPPENIRILFKIPNNGENSRILNITANGKKYEDILQSLYDDLNK